MSELDELHEIGASQLARGALLIALMTKLQEKNLLSTADVDAIFDDAMSSLERAKPHTALLHRARRVLERTARNLVRPPAGRP